MALTDPKLSDALLDYARRQKEFDIRHQTMMPVLIRSHGPIGDDPNHQDVNEEERAQVHALWHEEGALEAERDALAARLVELGPIVLEDPQAHKIAAEIRSEALSQEVKRGWGGRLQLFRDMGEVFYPGQIAENFARISPLFLLQPIPKNVEGLVREAIKAYCLELPTATSAVARSMVEATVVDIALRIGRIKDPEKVREMRMCERISSLIDKSLTKQSPLRRKIDQFMGEASEVVHSDSLSDMAMAKAHLETAFELVKELRGYYRHQMPPQSADSGAI